MFEDEKDKREGFASHLGFIFASAACAIGLGNIWKFPYIAGENGGAVFVLFYLAFLALMGVPVMIMELAIGRSSRQSIVRGYKNLEKKNTKWHIHGWVCVIGCYMLMMYYTTVSGWLLDYFYKFANGEFSNVSPNDTVKIFNELLANPLEMGLFMAITAAFGFFILGFGVRKGLEKATKFMMVGLLLLIFLLAAYSLTLNGASEGISFYLLPDWERAKSVGLMNVIAAAMNQAFFTLSLGIGALEIFGSYMSKENTLTGEAIRICVLDTLVALTAGLIIFPACFSYGIQPSQGPSLIFITLPGIFLNIKGGMILGTLFFIFMTFAAFSTVITIFENLVANLSDNFGISRKKSVVLNMIFVLIANIPCILGYNVWKNIHIIGDRGFLDSEDFIVSNLLLPLGALVFILFCATKYGWGFDNCLKEINSGKGMRLSPKLKPYFLFILPLMIISVVIGGLVN